MSVNLTEKFAQIGKMLIREGGSTLHRQVFVLAGGETWQKNVLQNILQGYETESLWVGEQEPENFPFVSTKKVHSWLGSEKKIVIFDANSIFDPDCFAAVSGIVVGGGLFFLLMPPKEKWNSVYFTPFGQRLIKNIVEAPELVVITEKDNSVKFHSDTIDNKYSPSLTAPFLTLDQQNAVESIEQQVFKDTNNPVVLISDRGRGKSAALGLVAVRLIKSGIKKIAITAPRLRATNILFKHIAESLPDAAVSHGSVIAGDSMVQFYSPDELMNNEIESDVLLIDEAAAIPVPMLTSFLDNYKQCVFATTVHGYEGTGRGFSLRFNKVLNEKYPDWLKLEMETPIRWADNDPLENWMFSLLCLDAEIVNAESIGKIEANKLEQRLLNKEDFIKNEVLLNEIFSLLVLAHYRTRPSDLKSLLDDDSISLYITIYKEHVLAVALVSREGRFSNLLSSEVYRGERRPQGNLLAQALTYHCGVEHAAILDYARVMRIAVHPNFQLQGIGTGLLDFIINEEKVRGRDAVGTSFGMNDELLRFWIKLKFEVVRIGFTREQTSGEHAAIMLLPLTSQGDDVHRESLARFNQQLPYWFDDVLNDLPIKIKDSFNVNLNQSVALNEYDEKDLQSFIHSSRNYELCISAITKLVMGKHDEIVSKTFPGNFRQVITCKVIKKIGWKEIREIMDLSGKNEARQLFHSAICYLMKSRKAI